MNKRNIQFMAFIQFVFLKLSPTDIQETLNSFEADGKDTRTCSILNPIFGYLFEASGTLANLRFFSPEIYITKESETRSYQLDSSLNPITHALIQMFPSPSGVLVHIRNIPSNFGYNFKENLTEGIEVLANLFVKVLNPNLDIEFNEITKITGLEQIVNSLLDNTPINSKIFFDSDEKMIKLMLIHAFIINVVDRKEDLKKYIKIIYEKSKNTDFQVYDLNYNLMEEVLQINDKLKAFPYSFINQPSSNGITPVYCRKTNTFHPERTFSDCVDILILNICNCLLYDSTNRCYSIKALNGDSDLASFYQKYKEPFTITDEIRKEWSTVIQGLNNFKGKNISPYKINDIVYLKKKRNELDTGIINMMNVLIKIFNIDHQSFWNGFLDEDIEIMLKKLFEKIFLQLGSKITTLKVDSICLTKFISEHRIDFEGKFNLIFNQSSGNKAIFSIVQRPLHASLKLIEYKQSQEVNLPIINVNSSDYSLPIIIFNSYCYVSQNIRDYNDNTDIFYKIYFSGPILTNDQLKETLLNICDGLLNLKKSVRNFKILKSILMNILNSVNLNDYGTKLEFAQFLVYLDDLRDDEILSFWCKSFTSDRVEVYKLWEERVLKLNVVSLDLKLLDVANVRIPAMFKTLKKFKNLRNIKIWGIFDQSFESISQGLAQLENLESLDISDNYIGETGSIYLAEALKSLPKLKKLDLTDVSLGSQGAKNISDAFKKLKKLSSLKLSKNDIGVKGAVYLSQNLCELINLKVLDISINSLYNEGVKSIANAIENLYNIENIILSQNSIDSEGLEYIVKALQSHPNITNINLSRNKINPNESRDIIEMILQFEQIEKVNFSYNYKGFEDVMMDLRYINGKMAFRLKNSIFHRENINLREL